MKGFEDSVIIDFPLRGEWMAPNTPGSKIPSHGTDQLGQRYAFDFIQVDWARSGKPFYHSSLYKYLLGCSAEEVLWLGTRCVCAL